MNASPSRLVAFTAAGLAAAFGMGVWTGSRLLKNRNGVGAEFIHPAERRASDASVVAPQSLDTAAKGYGEPREPDLTGLSPAAAWKALEALNSSNARQRAIFRHLKTLPPQQWLSWVEQFLDEKKGIDESDPARMAAFFGVINDLLEAVTDAGAEEYLSGGGMSSSKGYLIARKWAERDPAGAGAWLEKVSNEAALPPEGASRMAAGMAAVMARRNSAEALRWAGMLPRVDGVRSNALKSIVEELTNTNPEEAARVFTLHAADITGTGKLAGKTAAALAGENPRVALAWASAVSPEVRRDALAGALSKWTERDFSSAFTAVKEMEGESTPFALSVVIGAAPQERLPEVAALLEAQPEGDGRAWASGDLMRTWTHLNPEEASAWMKRQPPGPVQDQAISAFVRWADVRDPQAAFMWADTVSNPKIRTAAIDHIIQQLGADAPEAVEAWLAASPTVHQEEREQVQQRAADQGRR